MKKKILIVSIIAVLILLLVSFTSVVGYQSVKSDSKITSPLFKVRNNPKDLLFQTILDLANNKEQLRRMYVIGQILSKRISNSRIQSMIQTHQLITPEMQQKIDTVIGNNAVLNDEITQLLKSDCDCDNSETTEWGFPIICTVLLFIMGVVFIPWMLLYVFLMLPPNAMDEMIDLLLLMLFPVLIIWERFNCRIPEVNHPFPSDISPADGEQNVSLDLTELSFRLTDKDVGPMGRMSYRVTTTPPIGEGERTWVPSGRYTIPVHGLQENTKYTWMLYLYSGGNGGTPMGHKYTFTTEAFTPFILNPSPRENDQFVPINTSNVSFDLMDYQNELMNWTVETQPDIGSGSGAGVANGRYTVPISGLDYFTTYTWFVNVTDGTYWAKKTFSFRTTTEYTAVFEPTDDAVISEKIPTDNYGTSETIRLRTISGWDLDGLIKFNLSAVPSNVTIQYAALQAFYYKNKDGNPSGHQMNLYRNTNDWDEETVTWNTQPSYVTEPSSFAIMPATINNWVFWNVTGDTLMFYNSGTPNYGWRIMDTSGQDNEVSYFRTKDYIENHPLLIIGYE